MCVPDGLFELLMQMVAETVRPENQLVTELSSVASACLLSLVVALGDTSKMLAALTAMLTAPGDLTVQVCRGQYAHMYMYSVYDGLYWHCRRWDVYIAIQTMHTSTHTHAHATNVYSSVHPFIY